MSLLSQKAQLLRGLIKGNHAYTGPFFVTIDLTQRCNLKCPGCRFHSKHALVPGPVDLNNADFSVELFRSLCSELKRLGTQELFLTGEGEPFLHPNLIEFVRMGKAAGFKITLITNGTLMDKRTTQELITEGLDSLKVSLWAGSEKTYAESYPGAPVDNFRRITSSLEWLGKEKKKRGVSHPYVTLHHPITQRNVEGIPEYIQLAHTLGCDKVSFSPLKIRQGRLNDLALTTIEENRLKQGLKRYQAQLAELSMDHNIDHTLMRYRLGEAVWVNLPCYIGWVHARIKVDGSVMPCNPCDMVLGSLRTNSFRTIWNSEPFKDFRMKSVDKQSLKGLSRYCDCGFCCHVGENSKIHHIYKWFYPLSRIAETNRGISKN